MPVSILIVDDNAPLPRLLRSRLEGSPDGAVRGEAENSQVAVEKVKTLDPDVVILDWLMPVMSGLESSAVDRQLCPQHGDAYADPAQF